MKRRALVLSIFLTTGFPVFAAWSPPEDAGKYGEVLTAVREGEGYTRFLETEKEAINDPGDAYHETRWKFLRQVYRAEVATPDGKQINAFVNACKQAGWLKPEKEAAFRTAVLCLGKELIIDKSPFQIPLENIRVERDVPYAKYGSYSPKLDIFLPENKTSKPLPCIVFIHCGGWEVHKRAWFECHARVAAREGFAALNIDYRLLPGVTPVDCVYDAKAAVRFIRANAKNYGIDPKRIGAFGASAGAQLTTLLATSADDKSLEGPGGNAGVSSRIKAGVAFATPVLSGRRTWPIGGKGEIPPWFKKISPYEHAGAGDAPLLLVHGGKDTTVHPDEPKDLQTKLNAAGVLCEVEIIPNAGHVCYMSEDMSMKAIAFFQKHL
ncbi:MAG: alpha/beta hydrolase [Verrucomicrobiota bacterium]